MASEYLKWKYRDVKPREEVELTPKEKRKNWWHYHKRHVVIGVVAAVFLAVTAWESLGRGGPKPDYQFAYVGSGGLSEDTVSALETGLAALGTDQNGDGKVVVSICQYPYSTDPQTVMAVQIRLMADLSDCESYFFLLEDPDQFQASYHILCRLDGSLPEDDEDSAQGMYLPWTQCPALAGLDPDGEVSGLSLARRGFWSEKTAPYPEGCQALWSALTQGAG